MAKRRLTQKRKNRLTDVERFISSSEDKVDYLDVSHNFGVSPSQAINDLVYIMKKNPRMRSKIYHMEVPKRLSSIDENVESWKDFTTK